MELSHPYAKISNFHDKHTQKFYLKFEHLLIQEITLCSTNNYYLRIAWNDKTVDYCE